MMTRQPASLRGAGGIELAMTLDRKLGEPSELRGLIALESAHRRMMRALLLSLVSGIDMATVPARARGAGSILVGPEARIHAAAPEAPSAE